MKKNNGSYIKFLFILIIFFVSFKINNVYAWELYNNVKIDLTDDEAAKIDADPKEMPAANINLPNKCLDDNTCFVACNYYERMTEKEIYIITIYYYPGDNGWEISWSELINLSISSSTSYYAIKTKVKNHYGINFSSDTDPKVYNGGGGYSTDEKNFVCPTSGFIDSGGSFDTDTSHPNNSICFDSAYYGSKCAEISLDDNLIYNNFVNYYQTHSSNDNILGTINMFYTIGYNNELGCSDSGEVTGADSNADILKYVTEKFYLKDENKIPEFIQNYIKNSLTDRNKTLLTNSLEAKKQYCEELAEDNVAAGITTPDKVADAIKANDSIQIDEILEKINNQISSLTSDVAVDTVEPSCATILGNVNDPTKLMYWLEKILNIMKYVAVIILVITGSIDFVKAVVSQDGDALKKAGTTFVKRLAICIIIFFLPSLLNWILKIMGTSGTCNLS